MYFIPMGMLLKSAGYTVANVDVVGWAGFARNMIPVILGNMVGGSVLVGLVYYVIYLRKNPED